MRLDEQERTRLRTLTDRAARGGGLDRYDRQQMEVLLHRSGAIAKPATFDQFDVEPGEIRLADLADEAETARLNCAHAMRTARMIALGPLGASFLLVTGVAAPVDSGGQVSLVVCGTILLILSVVLVCWYYSDGKGIRPNDARRAVRAADVAYARLHRRLPDASDRKAITK